jgi:hypothetical protein
MRNHKKITFTILAALAVVFASFAALRSQGQDKAKDKKKTVVVLRPQGQIASTIAAQKLSEADQIPIADYNAPEISNPEKRARRQARGKRYDRQGWVKEPSSTTGNAGRLDSWMHRVPAFPVSISDAVVIGDVTDAQAYLSIDKTGVYTEFNIQIDEVLKNDGTTLTPSSMLTAQREGGRVRVPSGRIQLYKPHFQGTPRVGSRYVFFLKRNDDGQSYYIWTGYELRAGHVRPLDGVGLPGGATELPQFAAYKDADEVAFLSALRAAIANPSEGSRE